MKKSKLLWMCAVLMIGGLCSCNSDDENIVGSGEIVIPEEIPENSLLILSDKGEISYGELYKSGECYNPPHCNLEIENRYNGGNMLTIYHMRFGANIKGSDVFDMLTIGFQSNRQMSFNDLKEGDTFDSSQFDAAAAYTPTWMEAILKGQFLILPSQASNQISVYATVVQNPVFIYIYLFATGGKLEVPFIVEF